MSTRPPPKMAAMQRHKGPTVRDCVREYLARLERRNRKPNTIRCARSALARLEELVGDVPVDRLDLVTITRIHESWHRTPVVADRMVAYLSAALTHAERLGWRITGSNFCRLIERYNPRPILEDADAETLRAILGAVENLEGTKEIDWVSALAVRLLVYTGCRLREVLNARWEYVDEAAGLLRLPDSKTGRKDVALCDDILAILARAPVCGPFICPGKDSGRPRENIRTAWEKIRAAVGQRIRRHDIRHGFARALRRADVPMPKIGELLGHADGRTTQRYAGSDVGRLRGLITSALQEAS